MNVTSDCVAFWYVDLRDATNNFHDSHLIGEGSFGQVFKAIINQNGRPCKVAIKRLSSGFHIGLNEELNKEIWKVSTMQHKNNILSLLG